MIATHLRFPELTLYVNRAKLTRLISSVEHLRDKRIAVLSFDEKVGAEKSVAVELVASGEIEVDEYTRTGLKLTLALSPEAFDVLLAKLWEMNHVGGFSTPEFYEFYAALPKGKTRKTLRVFLAEKGDAVGVRSQYS